MAPRGEQRVDAAARADVERAAAALAHGQHVARARGRRVARDVVRRIVGVAREPVGCEQHVGDRDEARGRHDVAAELGEPRTRQAPRRPSGRARRSPPPPARAAGGTGAGSPCRAATSAAAAPRRARPPSCPSTHPRRAGRRACPPCSRACAAQRRAPRRPHGLGSEPSPPNDVVPRPSGRRRPSRLGSPRQPRGGTRCTHGSQRSRAQPTSGAHWRMWSRAARRKA